MTNGGANNGPPTSGRSTSSSSSSSPTSIVRTIPAEADDSEASSLLGKFSSIVTAAKAKLPLPGSPTSSPPSPSASFEGNVDTPKYAVYPRRYWVLFMLSIVAMQQTSLWMSYSPVQSVVQKVYGWTPGTITMLVAWGPIIALPMVALTPMIVSRVGLRASVTLCAALSCCCAVLRCITTESPYALYLAHIGQILNAAAGPVATCVPSLLSAQWFESEYRTTATAVSTMAENLGSVAGFLAGLAVRGIQDWDTYVGMEAGIAVVILCLALFDHWWPATPPLPPSASTAAANKEEALLGERSLSATFQDMWKMCRNRNFMLLVIMYAISVGTATAWAGVIDPVLAPLGYNQQETGMIGFVALLCGMGGGLTFALLADKIRAVKSLLLGLFTAGLVSFGWLAMLCSSKTYGDGEIVGVMVSSSVGMFCIIGATALFYEEGVEAVFPLGPLPANAVLGMGYAMLMACFFLMTTLIPPKFMCWLLPSACLLSLLALLGFEEKHTRRAIDAAHHAAVSEA